VKELNMFHGSMVALATPMHAAGDLDFDALETLLEFHIKHGTTAVIVAGTTGEAGLLTIAEKKALFKAAVKVVQGRIAVIAGTAATGTRSTVELTELALHCGVDGALIMTPAYVKPTQHGLLAHYKAVAAAVALPLILYNVPGRTACDLLPETIIELAQIPNVVGVKEATGELFRAQHILAACGDKIDIYSGDDSSCCELMLLGAKGVISVTSNVAPRQMAEMSQAALRGDEAQAIALDARLQELHRCMSLETNPIPVKWALMHRGLIDKGIRLPLTELSVEHHVALRAALAQIN
jgi:4-hydroxy-tetrahydrodipicolinate synthase